jgi:hypothetical protein
VLVRIFLIPATSMRAISGRSRLMRAGFLSYLGSKRVEPTPPYVCPGCSNHTYSNNMIIR